MSPETEKKVDRWLSVMAINLVWATVLVVAAGWLVLLTRPLWEKWL